MWRARVVRSPYFRWTIRPISESCRTSQWSRRFTASRSTREPTACTRQRNKKRASPHRRCLSSRPCQIKVLLLLLAVLLIPTSTLAYRPFVSTDAAVADPREVEIEVGYFTLERTRQENTITTPSVVLNYGFAKNWEAVGEFRVEASPSLEITDPGLSVKGVLKEGVLQEKEGVSFAIETGLLLPSTLPHERGVGVQAIGIVSVNVAPVTVHVNGGGGLDRDDRHAFAIWGVIGELPVHPKLRLGAEVNGESTQGQRPNNSALLGVIWHPTSKNVFLDAGVRRGISRAAPDWQFTIGLTFGFSLPTSSRQ